MNERINPTQAALDQDGLVDSALRAACAIDCEQVVIGAILISNPLFQPISALLVPDDFSEDLHRRIFAAMGELADAGKPITIMLLKACIGEMPGPVTTSAYLAKCASDAPVLQSSIEYARIVRELSARRKLISISADAIRTAQFSPVTAKTHLLATEVVSALDEVASSGLPHSVRKIGLGAAAMRAVEASHAARDGIPTRGLSTGLDALDKTIGGLEPGQGTVLAGRPSMGKTACALDIALNVAKTGKGVFYVSLEMGGVSLASRAISSVTFDDAGQQPIQYNRIAKGNISNAEMKRCERAAEEMERWPFIIEQQTELTVSQITARVRQAKLQMEAQGVDLALVVVDHIGLVASSSRYRGDRVREIGEISVNLHGLARELDVHVLMLSQLSRAIESRSDKRPQLHDLRESGEIEQNADLVLGVFREEYYLERGEQTGETVARLAAVQRQLEIGVLKNRQGPTGPVHLFIDIGSNAVRGLG